jgi:hypothetical protein
LLRVEGLQTPTANLTTDTDVARRVNAYAERDAEHWSYRGNATREHSHAYFQYPAMMVPGMQEDLIRTIIEAKPSTKALYDPFAGSGTVLTEAILLGRDFLARDINPLAVLLCNAKKGPFFTNATTEKATLLLDRIANDKKTSLEVRFPGRDKWFTRDVSIQLSRIRRAIREEPALWCRRFFWITLAETIRVSSNSRTSTFKLHIRPATELATRHVDPVATFTAVLEQNIENLESLTTELQERELLIHGHYKQTITVELHDARQTRHDDGTRYDLLVTSPPYGDNTSTVPYGQAAFLPLQWIDLHDIDPNITDDCIATTHEIDYRSLGGSKKDALKEIDELKEQSPSFRATLAALEQEPRDRATRVAAFTKDLNKALNPILAMLRHNAYLIWTVGNRRVAQRPVPLDAILTELLHHRHVVPIASIARTIPTKRMALKNNITETMGAESILVFRKGT